jgi:hypothetical protein
LGQRSVKTFSRKRLNAGAVIEELRLPLNSEILYFLGSFALIEPDLFQLLMTQLSLVAMDAMQYRRNVLGALLYTGRKIHGLRASNCVVSRVRLRDPTLVGPSLSGIQLKEVTFETFRIIGGQLQTLRLENCSRGEFQLESCNGAVTIVNSQFAGIQIRSSANLAVTMDSSSAEKLDVSNVQSFRIGSGAKVARVVFASGKLEIDGSVPFENGMSDLSCNASEVRSRRGSDGAAFRRIQRSHWTSCKFQSFCMFGMDAEKAVFNACDGIILLFGVDKRPAFFIAGPPSDPANLWRYWKYDNGALFVDHGRARVGFQDVLPDFLSELRQEPLSPTRLAYWDRIIGTE